jgi:hypothetical protein
LKLEGSAPRQFRDRQFRDRMAAKHVYPVIGDMAVGDVAAADLGRVFGPLKSKPALAKRLKAHRCLRGQSTVSTGRGRSRR